MSMICNSPRYRGAWHAPPCCSARSLLEVAYFKGRLGRRHLPRLRPALERLGRGAERPCGRRRGVVLGARGAPSAPRTQRQMAGRQFCWRRRDRLRDAGPLEVANCGARRRGPRERPLCRVLPALATAAHGDARSADGVACAAARQPLGPRATCRRPGRRRRSGRRPRLAEAVIARGCCGRADGDRRGEIVVPHTLATRRRVREPARRACGSGARGDTCRLGVSVAASPLLVGAASP